MTAPLNAGPTDFEYFHKVPVVYSIFFGFHFFFLLANSFRDKLTFKKPLSASLYIISPFLISPIGPPTAASGPTCPIEKPCVPPEKRPSVIKATSSPSPCP